MSLWSLRYFLWSLCLNGFLCIRGLIRDHIILYWTSMEMREMAFCWSAMENVWSGLQFRDPQVKNRNTSTYVGNSYRENCMLLPWWPGANNIAPEEAVWSVYNILRISQWFTVERSIWSDQCIQVHLCLLLTVNWPSNINTNSS